MAWKRPAQRNPGARKAARSRTHLEPMLALCTSGPVGWSTPAVHAVRSPVVRRAPALQCARCSILLMADPSDVDVRWLDPIDPNQGDMEPSSETATVDSSSASNKEEGTSFAERYSEVLGKVNETLDQVDWNQMGRISKIVGIFAAVIIIQILIKGILDTINLLPIIPGLLELLGVVVVGQWGWKNLATSEKRTSLIQRIQTLRQEYLG